MNQLRFDALIEALESEAGAAMFNIAQWVFVPEGAKTPDKAFKAGGGCGTTACMAGLAAAIDQDFFEFKALDEGYSIKGRAGNTPVDNAFCQWLEIPFEDSMLITNCSGHLWAFRDTNDTLHAVEILKRYKLSGKEGLVNFQEELKAKYNVAEVDAITT